jgi:hypothetical protein
MQLRSFLSDIFIIVGGKIPIGRIAESKRGNKEYSNLGLILCSIDLYIISAKFHLKNLLTSN